MNRNKYVFWGLVITTLISALDANIMQTASPTIVDQLGRMELFAWIFSVYMLASTVTVPLYGKLADMYGRKNLLMIAVGIFTLGSILCGLANSMVTLIIYRGIQGLGAGGMIPLSMIIVGDLFSIEKRGKIQAVFSSIWADFLDYWTRTRFILCRDFNVEMDILHQYPNRYCYSTVFNPL